MRPACQILSDPTWYVRIYPAAPPQPRLRVSVCPRRSRRCRVNWSARPPVAAPLPWYPKNSKMAQTRPLPRICIALGFPDLDRLMEHARREAEAGESFLEFRLDYLEDPERGAQAIRGFLEQYPDCIVLATCRRHQNRGKFNGSIEEEMRVLECRRHRDFSNTCASPAPSSNPRRPKSYRRDARCWRTRSAAPAC